MRASAKTSARIFAARRLHSGPPVHLEPFAVRLCDGLLPGPVGIKTHIASYRFSGAWATPPPWGKLHGMPHGPYPIGYTKYTDGACPTWCAPCGLAHWLSTVGWTPRRLPHVPHGVPGYYTHTYICSKFFLNKLIQKNAIKYLLQI